MISLFHAKNLRQICIEHLERGEADGSHPAVIGLSSRIPGVDRWASIDELNRGFSDFDDEKQAVPSINRDIAPFATRSNLYWFSFWGFGIKVFAISKKQFEPKSIRC